MKFAKLFADKEKFRSIEDVKQTIKTSRNYKNETIDTAKVLNFFSTSKQKSYLVATNKMVYCIVDDAREEQAKVNWSERKLKFAEMKRSIDPKTDKVGHINFGENHIRWLFTRSIFVNDDVESKISEILS